MIRDDLSGWVSIVIDDFDRNGVEIKLAQRRERGVDFVTSIAPNSTMETVFDQSVGPEPMRLPRAAASVLRDALNEFFGPPSDDYRSRYDEARDSLDVERGRVDRLLGKFLTSGGGHGSAE